MDIQLYNWVSLKVAVPKHDLRAGDVATLLDYVPNPSGGAKDACWKYSMPSENPSRSSPFPRQPSSRSAPTRFFLCGHLPLSERRWHIALMPAVS